jgi:hypothetical protein
MVERHCGPELPLYRLYVLRVAYLVLGLWQGFKTWPAILHHAQAWDFWQSVGMSFLGGLTLLCLLGMRYPVRMMPLLMVEFTWKLIWVLAAWLPPYLGHRLEAGIAGSFWGIFPGVVVVPLFLPWGYVWQTYVTLPGDRWR